MRLLRIAVLISIASGSALFAAVSEFRSPLRVTRGVMHWPLAQVEDTFWYDDMPEGREETKCHWNTWGAAYRRVAHKSFDPCECNCTSDTVSLSSLWFGKESFRGEEIFAGGQLTDCQDLANNTALGWARITPRFDYNEHGVVAGVHYYRDFGCDDKWHTGFRLSLPVKEIEIEHNAGCQLEETLDDVVKRLPTDLDANNDSNQVEYAYRLDFLSTLCRTAVTDFPNVVEMVQYGDGSDPVESVTSATRIAGVLVNSPNAEGNGEFPPAYVQRSDRVGQSTSPQAPGSCKCACDDIFECGNVCASGRIPNNPLRKAASEVSGALNADGSGGGDGSVLFFKDEVDYLGGGLATDRNAQGKLFVVPRRQEDEDEIVSPAVAIDEGVQSVLRFLDPSETASAFFCDNGIDLYAHERVVGVGDLDFEWQIGYGQYDDWFTDLLIGVRFPTGTKPKSAKRIYHKPTGNNRHFELKIGLEGGWQPCDWFAFRLDLAYNHAFKRSECRAAPFCKNPSENTSNGCSSSCDSCKDTCKKACDDCCKSSCDLNCCENLLVKNIGPSLDVDVAWDYFVGHLDFTIFHPHNPELGMVIGYQLMVKGDDNIKLNCDSCCNDSNKSSTSGRATDLLGRPDQPLDLSILECNTGSRTHKIYGDIFHRWNYFELFGGASHIVAGRHAMQETEAHLGMKIFF